MLLYCLNQDKMGVRPMNCSLNSNVFTESPVRAINQIKSIIEEERIIRSGVIVYEG